MAVKETKVILTGDTSKYERVMRDTQLKNRQFTNTLKKHWVTFAAAAIASVMALQKAFSQLSRFITAASDLQETTSKFNVVFADQITIAQQWSKTLVDGYAMSTRESRQYLSSIQDLLVPMGMVSKEAGKMSFEVVKLAADLGSFNNVPTAKVMDDIQSGLVGNYETMKKYGVILNATTVQEKAMAMGLAETKNSLTAADKAQAAYTIMVKGSKAAIGDMARTSGDYANTLKQMKAAIEDLEAGLGILLLPTLTEVTKAVGEFVRAWADFLNIPEEQKKFNEQREMILKHIHMYEEELDRAMARKGKYGWWERFMGARRPEEIISDLQMMNEELAKVSRDFHEKPKIGATGKPSGGGGIPEPKKPTAEFEKILQEFYKDNQARLAESIGEESKYIEQGLKEQLDLRAKIAQQRIDLEASVQSKELDLLQEAMNEQDKYIEQGLESQGQNIQDNLKKNLKDFIDTHAAQIQFFLDAATAVKTGISTILYDTMQKDLASFKEYFKAFTDSLKQAFASMIADMIMRWLYKQVVEAAMHTESVAGFAAENALIAVQIGEVTALTAAYWALAVAKTAAGASGGGGGGEGIFGSIFGALGFHSGGVVGSTPVPVRMVNTSVFQNAPRYHQGMGNDEFPAILQRGETVIPRGGGGQQPIVIKLEIGGKPLNTYIYRGSRSGTIQIHQRALVSR